MIPYLMILTRLPSLLPPNYRFCQTTIRRNMRLEVKLPPWSAFALYGTSIHVRMVPDVESH